MLEKEHADILERIAEEYDLPVYVVENIVKSQFKFVQDKMQEGECAKVRLHHFGVFKVKPKRLYIINKDTE